MNWLPFHAFITCITNTRHTHYNESNVIVWPAEEKVGRRGINNKWHLKERHKRLLRYLTVNNIENPLKFNYNKKPSHSFNDVYRTISDVCVLFTFLGWQSMRMVLFRDFLLTESCTTDLFITAFVQRSPVSVSPTPALAVCRSHPRCCRHPSCPPKSSGHRHRVCLRSLLLKKQRMSRWKQQTTSVKLTFGRELLKFVVLFQETQVYLIFRCFVILRRIFFLALVRHV